MKIKARFITICLLFISVFAQNASALMKYCANVNSMSGDGGIVLMNHSEMNHSEMNHDLVNSEIANSDMSNMDCCETTANCDMNNCSSFAFITASSVINRLSHGNSTFSFEINFTQKPTSTLYRPPILA